MRAYKADNREQIKLPDAPEHASLIVWPKFDGITELTEFLREMQSQMFCTPGIHFFKKL